MQLRGPIFSELFLFALDIYKSGHAVLIYFFFTFVVLQKAMEVVVAEEKKKIFRARKTMKMSDRLQLESLHSTLLTSASSLSSPSPPPLMNGTHKDDGQKAADKEQNNISGSNSPNATSPVSQTPVSSPVPFLSLNLSPSPPGSQSPKDQEVTSPRTPAQSAFFDCNKAENEDSSPALLDESSSSTQPKKDTTGAPLDEEEQVNVKKFIRNSLSVIEDHLNV